MCAYESDKNPLFRQAAIPDHIKDLCIKMLKKLDISFGAFDLVKDRNGEIDKLKEKDLKEGDKPVGTK